jgi:hypothetical protein
MNEGIWSGASDDVELTERKDVVWQPREMPNELVRRNQEGKREPIPFIGKL